VLRHARALQTLRAFARPDTVLFDLDGTLIDSVEDIHVAVNALLAELGFATRTRDEVAMWPTLPCRDFARFTRRFASITRYRLMERTRRLRWFVPVA
jgi:phosphoglycolate phosphatase-like HAD superfamily hydrolase